MTYAQGSNVLATDFNAFAGETATAAAAPGAAQNIAGYLWGIGYGDRGYGQTTPALSAKSAGNNIGQEWQDMRTVLLNLANWQNTSTALLPPPAAFSAGSAITAHEQDTPSSNLYDLQNLLALLDANRLNYQLANMSLTSNVVSTTRSTTWGSGVAGITAEFKISFASENAARFFFNTGGQIRVSLSHPTSASKQQDNSWNSLLSGLVVAFGANGTTKLGGTYGTPNAIGYYQLTTSYQTILNGSNQGLYIYSADDFYVDAMAQTITGVAGAKGQDILIRVRLIDEYTGTYDLLQAGTNANISILKASTGITVAAPTCTVVTAF